MKLRSVAMAASTVLAFFISLGASGQERLLPSVEAEKAKMTWRQDGKAMYVNIKNDTRLIITEAKLTCWFYSAEKPRPPRPPNGLEWCSAKHWIYDNWYNCQRDSTLERMLFVEIRPGRSKEEYFELDLKSHPLRPLVCSLSDFRGREPKIWEF